MVDAAEEIQLATGAGQGGSEFTVGQGTAQGE